MKKLICVYTCQRDVEFLNKLKQTDWYKEATADKNNTVFSVYADPTIGEEYIIDKQNNTLIVKAEEEYSKLSLKTYQMIKACVDFEEFDYLIKVDSTIVDDLTMNSRGMRFETFLNKYYSRSLYEDYDGPWFLSVTNKNIINWFKMQGISHTNPYKVFKSDEDIPSFYSGKSYIVGYEFCKYISKNGKPLAELMVEHVGGAEDLTIATLYEEYKKTLNISDMSLR